MSVKLAKGTTRGFREVLEAVWTRHSYASNSLLVASPQVFKASLHPEFLGTARARLTWRGTHPAVGGKESKEEADKDYGKLW